MATGGAFTEHQDLGGTPSERDAFKSAVRTLIRTLRGGGVRFCMTAVQANDPERWLADMAKMLEDKNANDWCQQVGRKLKEIQDQALQLKIEQHEFRDWVKGSVDLDRVKRLESLFTNLDRKLLDVKDDVIHLKAEKDERDRKSCPGCQVAAVNSNVNCSKHPEG